MIGGRRAEWPPRIGYTLQSGLIKGTLLFLAGLFAGANLLYFALSRNASAPVAPQSAPGAVPAQMPAPSSPKPLESPVPVVPDAPREAGNTALGPAHVVGPSAATVRPPSLGVVPAAGVQPLLIPVQGVVASQLQDTFNDARAQGRSHEAIDIMAPAGTPVLAVADGTVEKLFTSDAGGLTVYQFEPSGRYAYYYAHLQGYAPGLAEKQALRSGDLIGYVGSTGNANPAAPHLHFAVFVLGPERRWWQGTAINPYPLLHRQ